jgi:hypothetical protein
MCIFTHRIFFVLATDFFCCYMANCHVLAHLSYLANILYRELYRNILLFEVQSLKFYLLSGSFKEN